jgi:hypothetical protein
MGGSDDGGILALGLGAGRRVRVDALVTAEDRSAVVEVRARLQPGAVEYIDDVRDLVAALPGFLPVLLVMLGGRLTAHELAQIRGGRTGAVELLDWDKDAGSLVMMLRDLLRSQPARPAEMVM